MIGWLHCAAGVSGDMLLGALVDAGVPIGVLQEAVDAVTPEPIRLRAEQVRRAGLAATKVHVDASSSVTHRTWADVRDMLPDAAGTAGQVFAALASAEGRVHGVPADQVHFHEVGALDAIADVSAVCAGFAHLGLDRLVVSPVALGGGTVRAAHGHLPVPGPAVVELLRGYQTYGGPVDFELTTPTGAALVATLATGWGHQPPMRVSAQGCGAGSRDLPDRANVVRLLLGEPAEPVADPGAARDWVLATNVDDLDPRIWPGVLDALLAAGADDAWLTPVLMKKGRPAFTLNALVPDARVAAVREVVLAHTSAIGLRLHPVDKVALPRETVTVDVAGQPIRIKLARSDGRLVNAQPEWEDVAAAARRTGFPTKTVLAKAIAEFWNQEEQL
jgi:uncharacterized protein (TIGR00299 family) protein